jgi:hypothetical protein
LSKRLAALIGGALAVSLLAAGCGGGSDSNSSTASLTKAEFLKQGNAICKHGNMEIEAEFEKFVKEHHLSQNKQPTQAQLTEASETFLIPMIRKEVDQLKALGAPEGEEAKVDAIIEAAEESLETAEANPTSLTSENGGPFTKTNKLAKEYGLTACAEE